MYNIGIRNKVNLDTYNRKEHYKDFKENNPCNFSATIKFDISNLIKNKARLYPFFIYALSTILNKYDFFRMYLKNNELYYYGSLNPSFLIFHKDTMTYSSLSYKAPKTYLESLSRYTKVIEKYKDIYELAPLHESTHSFFNISMFNFFSFESFELSIKYSCDYFIPIFTIGKYEKIDDKYLIPINIKLNHAVNDAYHLGIIVNELNLLIQDFKI